MNENLNNQQPKAEPKWQAISSFVLGLISILPGASLVIYEILLNKSAYEIGQWFLNSGLLWLEEMIYAFSWYWFFFGWPFGIVGFIIGIIGLKYAKRNLATTGIILSIIGFVAYTYLFIIIYRFGTA